MSSISPGTILLGIVAVLFGLLGAFMVQESLNKPLAEQKEDATSEPGVFTVPMASTDLKAGREITKGDIGLFRMTSKQLAERGIDGPFMNNSQQIMGRVLKEDLVKGAVFTTNAFYPEGTGPDIGELLEPGQRAITVPVQLDAAVAGFAVPGTWVDVLFRNDANSDKELPETTVTLLERVKVLALDQQTFEGSRRNLVAGQLKSSFVTLAVTPADVNALGVVNGHGTLSLALRNPDDDNLVTDKFPRTLDELMEVAPPKRHRIEVFRGRQISSIEFNNRNRTTPQIELAKEKDQAKPPLNQTGQVLPGQNNQAVAVSNQK